MVVNNLELADASLPLRHLQELDDHLRAGAHEHLALAGLLRVHDRVKAIPERIDADHLR